MNDPSEWIPKANALRLLGLETHSELNDLVKTRLIDPPVDGLFRRRSLEGLLTIVRREFVPRLVMKAAG
ncbi:MAG: hypothetical protein ACYS22_19290 [Planctomycetota bacterium]|jgi:hypothetical protein